jgi:hypothetical protein
MSDSWKTVKAGDVRTGDVVRIPSGDLITVSRIETSFMGMPTMMAFIEDTDERWYKHPVVSDGDVEIRASE